MTISSAFTNWMITDKEFTTPSRPQMLAQPPYSFDLSVMYWAPTLALGGTLFAPSFSRHSGL